MKITLCIHCGRQFLGIKALIWHRIGQFNIRVGPGRRRCMDDADLNRVGYEKRESGVWGFSRGKDWHGVASMTEPMI